MLSNTAFFKNLLSRSVVRCELITYQWSLLLLSPDPFIRSKAPALECSIGLTTSISLYTTNKALRSRSFVTRKTFSIAEEILGYRYHPTIITIIKIIPVAKSLFLYFTNSIILLSLARMVSSWLQTLDRLFQ